MHDVLDIIKNINNLYENNSAMSALKDVERVFDELDLYVYDNWIDGEVLEGPIVERHWITVKLMWPLKQMPDPTGGKRLLDVGCKVLYKKTYLLEPRQIKSPDDIRPGTKKGKLDKTPIWVVEIQMPKEIAFDIYRGYMDKMKNEQQNTSAALKTGTPVPGSAPVQPPPAPAGMPPAAPAGMPPAAPAPSGAPM